MKIKIDIDCSPEEARAFLGLPDVQPLQDDMLKALKDRMLKAAAGMEPEALFKQWFQGGTQAFEQFQKAMWEQFGPKKKP
jgi:hypothetical protein